MSLYDTDTLLAQYLSAVNPESMSKRFGKPATKGVDEAYQDYYPEEYDNIDTTNTGPEIIEDITGDNTKTSDDFINTLLTTGLISGGPLIKIGSGLGLGYNMGANYFGLPTLGQMPDAAYKFGGSLYTPYGSYDEMLEAHKAREKGKKESTVVGTGTSTTGKAY